MSGGVGGVGEEGESQFGGGWGWGGGLSTRVRPQRHFSTKAGREIEIRQLI